MKLTFRAAQAGFVWLTAVTTLFAGVSPFACICPNGRHKPFCLGISSTRTGCCCGACGSSSSEGKCCCCQSQGATPYGQAEQTCCCENRGQPGTDSDTSTPSIQGNGRCCQKTLARDERVGVSPAVDSHKQNRAGGFSVPLPPLVVVPSPPMAGRYPFSWQSYELPPPTDLVIALQHFLI
jgi:hypothetical protein